MKIKLLVLLFVLSSLCWTTGQAAEAPSSRSAAEKLETRLQELPAQPLSFDEQDKLLHLFESQKMIRDVYARFFTQEIKALLDSYGEKLGGNIWMW